jgi:hypothetical protein
MKKIFAMAACLQVLLTTQSARAAETPAATGAAPPTVIADYHPSMADLMNIGIQPRHTKLGLAGQYRNWTYAAYELNELRNAFNRITRTLPVFNSADTAALFTSVTQAPLADLDKAIKASDAAQFKTAYGHLTEACNACHISQNKPMIVIKVPEAGMYPDQEFRPVHAAH